MGFGLFSYPAPVDSILRLLKDHPQVQEKVYVHTDNNCYFIGDTLWYKAYVLRADDHRPTDMSKLLYVELLTPDGLVVERQTLPVSDKGFSCGQFALEDSLYSGFYEIRAYTRWMLNFNVTAGEAARGFRGAFFSRRAFEDYMRDWEGLYSRVLPVYSKPDSAGNYSERYMFWRPKKDLFKDPKPKLRCSFFPEGGCLVKGLPSHVAFELTDQEGKAVILEGRLPNGDKVASGYLGRGQFKYVPSEGKERASLRFVWEEKEYDFELPDADNAGLTLHLDSISQQLPGRRSVHFQLHSKGCRPAAYAVMCRGRVCKAESLQGEDRIVVADSVLPSGVNELQVYDELGNVLADRMFFVNHHDNVQRVKAGTDKLDYEPYEPIQVSVAGDSTLAGQTFSLSIHDKSTEEQLYDDGNMLTDILLSSDLRGFVCRPSYYFESDDAAHRKALDLLMLVQGWRKYRPLRQQKNDGIGLGLPSAAVLRYSPEVTLTYEGSVSEYESRISDDDQRRLDEAWQEAVGSGSTTTDGNQTYTVDGLAGLDLGSMPSLTDNNHAPRYRGTLKHEVIVEAEIVKGKDIAGLTQKTHDGGRFMFQIPPYYDQAILFVTAYKEKDSLRKSLSSRVDKDKMVEWADPDFYVKRDIFYPVFPHPYNYYQNHLPELQYQESPDGITTLLTGGFVLPTVKVKARRRGGRRYDKSKPAYVVNAYRMLNEMTDRGLYWGNAPMIGTEFSTYVCRSLFAGMPGVHNLNIRSMLGDEFIDKNYLDLDSYFGVEPIQKRSSRALGADLKLSRIKNLRLYTDYEFRNPDNRIADRLMDETVTISYEVIPDDGHQPVYRDRRYVLDGITYPEKQYSPDYSQHQPDEPTDYRRTLYWNPNAMLDERGKFHTTVYNNCRETRVAVDVAGITHDGKVLVVEPD